MEYQKITKLLDKTPNQPFRFRTKKGIEIIDDSLGTYNTNSQLKFKTSLLKSSLYYYSDAHILVKGTITVSNTEVAAGAANSGDKKVIIKNCAPFTDCMSEINNTHVDSAKDIDVLMLMYNLIEYSDNYSKRSGRLWQYCRETPAVNNSGVIIAFSAANVTDLFNFKGEIIGQTDDNCTNNVEIIVPIKYLSNF